MRAVAALLVFLTWTPALAETAVLKQGDVLRGNFTQDRVLKGFARPIRSEGTFVIAPGRGLIWRTLTPFAVTTVVTPSGITQTVDGTETTRLASARLPFLSRLYDMMAGALAGDWGALEQSFVLTRTDGAVRLSPRGADDPAARQISAITARLGRFVEEVEIVRPGGDSDRLAFADQTLDTRPLTADEAALLK